MDDIASFTSETETLLNELNPRRTVLNENNYAQVVRELYGFEPNAPKIGEEFISAKYEIHHCFPQALFGPEGRYAEILEKAGININDPRLFVWWEEADHLANANAYNNEVTQFIEAGNRDIEVIINKIREMMNDYGFQVRF